MGARLFSLSLGSSQKGLVILNTQNGAVKPGFNESASAIRFKDQLIPRKTFKRN
jgi:hypothetical protein